MMTTHSTFPAADASSQDVPRLWRPLHEIDFAHSELRSGLATALDLFDETVEIYPTDSVKRHSTERYGIVAESIYAPLRSRITLHYKAPVHLLVLHEDGARREGETSIEGLPPSRLRNFAGKLTFIPAEHRYHEWHETSAPVRMTFLYLDPIKLQKSTHADAPHIPRVFFEDSILWATVLKLKSVIAPFAYFNVANCKRSWEYVRVAATPFP